jgi:7,8-dihydropterin-6-yl-methyl-4-(beta-D-ribofuranosyl)aminobenzene 5'-phosphate synthase
MQEERMRITILIDNNKNPSKPDLVAEHGLSLLVETNYSKLLFDTGASDLFIHNSKVLGIDLEAVDAVVLSHGHYDHGGGLALFLKINKRATVYIGPGALDIHFAKLFGILTKDIGLNRKALEPFSDRLFPVEKMTEIVKGTYVVPQINTLSKKPRDIGMFYRRTATTSGKDDFSHEMMLVVTEEQGMTLLTGCSHKGIFNIVSSAESQFPQFAIKAIVGGLHMTNPATKKLSESKEDIKSIGASLFQNDKVQKLFSGHCTGDMAYSLLKQEMGNKLESISVGMQIVV